MKIFTPIKTRLTGGTSSFARKFQEGARRRGHQVTFSFVNDYDAMLVIVSCPLRYLAHAKIMQRPIVQRLDGAYYYATIAGRLYPLLNLKPALIHHGLADYTIYQSQYSKLSVDRFLGLRRRDPSAIIYNGVNLEQFSPAGPSRRLETDSTGPVFITWSRFRRPDQIAPLISAITTYRRQFHRDARLLVIGSFSPAVASYPQKYAAHPGLRFLPPQKHSQLVEYARAADVFVMTHQNPPCPNNVIEAMALGLPICGVNDGAMSEITVPGKNSLLINAQGDGFNSFRRLDTSQLAANMAACFDKRDSMGAASRHLAEKRFSLDSMLDKYLSIFDNLTMKHHH